MWSRDEKCAILSPDVHVGEEYVCSYHVHGEPSEERRELGATPLTPELTGLYETNGGASCDACKHYDKGKCLAVDGDDGKPASVEAKGCCSRWDDKDGQAKREF